MEIRDWILVIVATFTLISSWGQFWIKEAVLAKPAGERNPVIESIISKKGIALIALTGIISAISIWLLVIEIMSNEPITRLAIFKISVLSILTFLNIVLIHSFYLLRRLAFFEKNIHSQIAARVSLGI